MQIKITKEQKKILYVSVIVLVSFVLYVILIHRPQGSRLLEIRRDLAGTENQIADILSLAKGNELTVAVKKLKTDLDKAYSQFPQGEEKVIRRLSDEASRLKIKVKNITSSGVKTIDEEIGGRNIEELFISMNLSCEYRQLGDYLNVLINNFPILIKVSQLEIKGAGEGASELDVDLKLSAFLSKEAR
ncbi:MAG: hypothetical protein PHI86_06705 [Candidatus Omnitrophica bacterium]|nr:hypothetical protein [Candidatus Omnitrophota bacterium]HOX55157.1 hypothetical protein [Candidatus Omnitrophota bacterium]